MKALNSLKDGFHFNLGLGNVSLWFDKWHQDEPICSLVDYVHISNLAYSLHDLWCEDRWHFNILVKSISEHMPIFLQN